MLLNSLAQNFMSLTHSVNFMADEPKQNFVTKALADIKKIVYYYLKLLMHND